MKLFEVSTKSQDVSKLLDNRIIFVSNGIELSGVFNLVEDEFLCKFENKWFASDIDVDSSFGAYVDSGRKAIQLIDLQKMYLIKEDSVKWPEKVKPLVSG